MKKVLNYKHALKNGLIPVITIAGINIGTLIAFSIITETVFQWPGMGFLIYSSSSIRRYTNNVSLFSFYSFCFCDDKFYSRYFILFY